MWQRVVEDEENKGLIHCTILRRYKERNGGTKAGQAMPGYFLEGRARRGRVGRAGGRQAG